MHGRQDLRFEGDGFTMVSLYMIYFSILSFVGYLYECLAMLIWTGEWDNRGFLFGPVIPIYGAGALAGTLLFHCSLKDHTPMMVFLVSVIASAVLEYVVHYGLEKAFHAYWWDYSKAPLNINGRICLPASLGFGVAGLLIIYVINPFLIPLLERIPKELAAFLGMLLAAIFAADTMLTVSTLSDFIHRVERIDERINERMDNFVDNHMESYKGIGDTFYTAVDHMQESGKKLIDKRIEKASDSLDFARSYILTRVKGFKGNKAAKRMNHILNRIKRRIKRKEDE